ncbi:MAG TPA: transcription termination/antitermination protein NusA [Candidatus Excrementavichristensenella intestinipullorum]|nr:transcription termination/antitermination protein NusA [Candidatus Excrementavichristensenella intestinipullorum]
MNAEFFDALEQLEKEKGIPVDYMLDKVAQALLTAYRRDNPGAPENVFVEPDAEKKTIRMFIRKTVTDDIYDPMEEIDPEEAKKYDKTAVIGDTVDIDIETRDFGRIAAQTAKQVIIQGIREAERGMVLSEFSSREHEILTGVVTRVDPRTGNVILDVVSEGEKTEAVLGAGEQAPGEQLREGQRIKVYVVEVRRGARGPQVLLSRTHPGLVKRLFELEVPEIADGTVLVYSVAREAGSRTKIAVGTKEQNVDPIGACVGPRGARVGAIVQELGGEKIDIVLYSDDMAQFVAAALSPADVVSATLLDGGKSCRVVVPDDQLSLAIGKEGQNARLAAKLTGWKIDIKSQSQAEQALEQNQAAGQGQDGAQGQAAGQSQAAEEA